MLSYVQGMLKSDSPQVIYKSDTHASKILQGLHESYQNGKFCDVTLIVEGKEVKAHKVVLSSFSLYFKGLFDSCWKENEQERIVIEDLDERTLKCLMNFIYSGELLMNTTNVLNLLAAADFLQLAFVKESCGVYLKTLVNDENCVAMLFIANKFNAMELENHLLKYAARHFYKVSQSDDFMELPVKQLVRLLQSESLVVDKGEDFLPSVAEQENVILDSVLIYVSHRSKESQPALIKELLQNVRLLLLSYSCLDNLQSNVHLSNSPEARKLVAQAMNNLSKTHPDKVPVEIPELWAKRREATTVLEKSCQTHCRINRVGPEQSTFNDSLLASGSDTYLNGMKIWIRLWDGRPVIGGLQTFYSNGQTSLYGGQDDESDIKEFHLEQGERIVKVDVSSGWMIDRFIFYTNKGKVLGPYGGPGGSLCTVKPKGSFGFLAFIRGTVVMAQEKLGVIKMSLVWREFLIDINSESYAMGDEEPDSYPDHWLHQM